MVLSSRPSAISPAASGCVQLLDIAGDRAELDRGDAAEQLVEQSVSAARAGDAEHQALTISRVVAVLRQLSSRP
jgi:hypothetical protein